MWAKQAHQCLLASNFNVLTETNAIDILYLYSFTTQAKNL
uniref:Uncharacterized protein n=1 Tax=Rhizophora mucronata TaxID=61149 RepID=A0A2P2Q442_RHIMU